MRGDSVSCSFGVCCLALLIASPAVDARADQPDEGIVLGQTVTVAGQDFFSTSSPCGATNASASVY